MSSISAKTSCTGRNIFTGMKQNPNESLAMFMSRLKTKAAKCDFGELYDRMVRDRFLYGLKEERLRAHLINKKDLTTSAQVLTAAVTKEQMDSASHEMSASSSKINWTDQRGKSKYKGSNSNFRTGFFRTPTFSRIRSK